MPANSAHGCSCGDLEFYYRTNDGPTQLLNREAFYASLPPGTPVLIVVHGSFTNWRGLCQDCGPVYHWIRNAAPSRPLAVIFYTWPSSAPIMYEPHLDVAILGMRATFNAVYLGDLVARLPAGHPICIMGHSHGARMTVAALHLLAGGEVDDTHLTYLPPPNSESAASSWLVRSIITGLIRVSDTEWRCAGPNVCFTCETTTISCCRFTRCGAHFPAERSVKAVSAGVITNAWAISIPRSSNWT